MFCPRCGLEQVTIEKRFCSRCGFQLTGLAEIIANGGVFSDYDISENQNADSPRKKGLKQGLIMFLLTFLVVPIIGILSAALNLQPWAVAISAIFLFVGGILRMIYALLFESSNPRGKTLEQNIYSATQNFLQKQPQQNALPPQQSIPTSAYAPPKQGNWRDTSDLVETSVTEGTTKLLDKEENS